MARFRIAVLRLNGSSARIEALDKALDRAAQTDLVVLDLFQAHSLSAPVVRALHDFPNRMRIVGANCHMRRILRISGLEERFPVIERSVPLCPPSTHPGIDYAELAL